jgi:ABC-type glycerol-3-phosphate transport system permease component
MEIVASPSTPSQTSAVYGGATDSLRGSIGLRPKRVPWSIGQLLVLLFCVVLLLLALVPMALMLILSLKSTVQIYGSFWTLPNPIEWSNYTRAFQLLARNMLNSTVLVLSSMLLTVLMSGMGGYVFAWLKFPGRKALFVMVLSLMMIPGILTLTPRYVLILDLQLKNTWWALVLPWVSGGQVFGILLCRTFMAEQPASLFESARIDGASEFASFWKIAVPLSRPILVTVAVLQITAFYNDFIWPLLVIDSNTKQVVTVAIRVFQSVTGATDIGTMVAGFAVTTVPLFLVFVFGSRYYIEGITSGAIKT